MRPGRGIVIGALVCGVLAAGATAPASAEERPPGDAGAYIDDGAPTVEAGDPGDEGEETTGTGDENCEWRVIISDDWEYGVYEPDGRRLYSETGRWLERWCDGEQQMVGGLGLVPEGGAVDVGALAASARESVPISAPPMATSPPADRELYTQVQTWLWVDEDWWTPYSATANAGRVSATVTARPVMADWTMGDGGSTACAGPGVEWHRGMDDSETYCSYVYRRSSSGEAEGTYALSVTVEFEVTWESNVGSGGSLSAVTRSATRQVTVGEIQAIETG